MDSTSSLLEFPGQIFHFVFTQDVVIPLAVGILLLVLIEIFNQ